MHGEQCRIINFTGDLGSFSPLENEDSEVGESEHAIGTIELYAYEPVGSMVQIASPLSPTSESSLSDGENEPDKPKLPAKLTILHCLL